MHTLILWVIYMVRKQFRNRRQRRSLVGHRQTVTLSDDAQLHRTRLYLVGMLARKEQASSCCRWRASGASCRHWEFVSPCTGVYDAGQRPCSNNGGSQNANGALWGHNLSDLLSQFVTKMNVRENLRCRAAVGLSRMEIASPLVRGLNKPQLVRTHDYGLGSPGAVGGTSGADSGCVGDGGGIGCGSGVSPGCGAISPAGGIPSVGSVGADQNPTGSI